MIFSVSNDGIQWTLNFGPGSVTIAVNDLHQKMAISSQEKPLAAWQLPLSQRQDFLNDHLARVPINPNQGGTIELREEVLSSVGVSDLGTSSYSIENPIVLDEEKDKEKNPPPTTPETVRSTEHPRLQRIGAFGARIENVPNYVFRKLFQ